MNTYQYSVKKTGKIWSVNFSERFHVAAVAKAEELVAEGKIGKVKQTIGTLLPLGLLKNRHGPDLFC